MHMPSNVAEQIRSYAAREYIQAARRRGSKRAEIKVGDVSKALKLRNLTPSVCSALRSKRFLEQNRLEIESESGPPSGMGTRTIITYRLLNEGQPRQRGKIPPRFEDLHGLLKEALHSLGGGENFLRKEREHFYDRGEREQK
jgi:hypothetical protein